MELTLDNTTITETVESHAWDNFYGYGSFYPGLYTREQAWKAREVMTPDLFRVALDVRHAGGLSNYYIGSYATKRTLLVNANGYPALELSGLNAAYQAKNWYHHVKKRGSERNTISSKNSTYVVKHIKPFLEPIIAATHTNLNSHVVSAAISFSEFLNDETNNAATIQGQRLNAEDMYAALRLMFEPGFTQAQIPSATLGLLQGMYNELVAQFTHRKSYIDRVQDMFAAPKWIILVSPFCTNNRLLVGAAQLKPNNPQGNSFSLSYTQPLKAYRDLSHFYETGPSGAETLKSALMFCKVLREKSPEGKRTLDPEGFLPSAHRDTYEDVGGLAYCGTYGAPTIQCPQVLLLGQ